LRCIELKNRPRTEEKTKPIHLRGEKTAMAPEKRGVQRPPKSHREGRAEFEGFGEGEGI